MKRRLMQVAFSLMVVICYSQVQVGLKYDINGQALNGYFNPFTYSPDNRVDIVHNSDSYEVGYYYNELGKKIEGKIKYENNKIWFKNIKGGKKEKIIPDRIKSFVIGVDSFFVTSNFMSMGNLHTEPEFVQFISRFNGNIVAKHYDFRSKVSQREGSSPILITYLIKSETANDWENFPEFTRQRGKLKEYFGHIPSLSSQFSTISANEINMISIIKMAEYYEKFQNKELIYFDKYWEETRMKSKATYYAKVSNIMDSIWTFSYFQDSMKLYRANYSSFYPNTKNGPFISYYPNGVERQIVEYAQDEQKIVSVYDESGKMITKYRYEQADSSNKMDEGKEVVYTFVADSTGNNLVGDADSFEQVLADNFTGLNYTNQYFKNELLRSYRMLDEDTVFSITDPNYNFWIESLQKTIDFHLHDIDFSTAFGENAQGIILVSFVIDNKGYVVDYSVLNSIHPEFDGALDEIIKSKIAKGKSGHRFEPYKLEGIKRHCEFVVPFDFAINRFYRKPVSYYNFNQNVNHSFMWQMNWQMQQQMQRQNQIQMQQHINNMRSSMPTF